MIQERFKDIYKGKKVAILGSGPTIELYDEKEDVAIAVNGAALISKNYHLFIAGDVASPTRDWWLASHNKNNGKMITRIVSSYIAPFDPILYPDNLTRSKLKDDLTDFLNQNNQSDKAYVAFVPSINPDYPHSFFTFGGAGEEFVNKISPDQQQMYWGGTISSIALQFALISGSKEINIYGCGFSNESGNEYCYICPETQKGKTNDKQAKIMQLTIDKIRTYGVKVSIQGSSVLI